MIKVTIYADADGTFTGFDMNGHAEYAEAGSDIVCAAVSMLCINTMNAIESFTEDYMICETDEAGAGIMFRLPKGTTHDTQLLLKTMILGLQGIEDNSEYEPYIDIIFEEV
ncbi:MAG: ribosomal-processing cysteine protease Prp [Schaedlerella sp.]|nr:ribosomal-processing cysteine protease Prp [Lachnospiraceae bacterium]MDY4203255.1 ribosomal-processing cysteine protease Prp [Schaedlerella sp.]